MHKKLLFETAVKFLLLEGPEQQIQPPPPAAPPSPPQTPPVSQTENPVPPTAGNEPGVDEIIGKLNTIRGGKSFSEPATYKAFSDFWASVQDKPTIVTFLDGAATAVSGGETPPTPDGQQAQPPGSVNPPTPPAPTPAPTQGTPQPV
jgi:hypothetical protein